MNLNNAASNRNRNISAHVQNVQKVIKLKCGLKRHCALPLGKTQKRKRAVLVVRHTVGRMLGHLHIEKGIITSK